MHNWSSIEVTLFQISRICFKNFIIENKEKVKIKYIIDIYIYIYIYIYKLIFISVHILTF